MKVQLKLVSYLPTIEQRRLGRKDLLEAIWEREREKFIPSCYNCKRRRSCLLFKYGTSDRQYKCLKRRVYLAYKFGYKLFYIKLHSLGFELGIKDFFKQAKEIDRIEKYCKEENSLEQAKLTNYLQGG